jgi:hypothetical protein
MTDYGDFGGGLPKLADSYPVPYENTFDGKIGFEITEIAPARAPSSAGGWSMAACTPGWPR